MHTIADLFSASGICSAILFTIQPAKKSDSGYYRHHLFCRSKPIKSLLSGDEATNEDV